MFDGSALPFKENMERARRVADYAHEHGVSLECEIGTIGGTEEGVTVKEGRYTDPQQALEFLEHVDVEAFGCRRGHTPRPVQVKDEIELAIN